MNPFNGYKASELQQVVDKLKVQLRFQITDAEIEAVFVSCSLSPPSKIVSSHVRKILVDELGKTMQHLCIQFSKKFEYEPKPRDLIVALEAAGYTCSRSFYSVLMKMLKEQNLERWAHAAAAMKKKRLVLSEGEKAMWEALQRTYNMNSDALASMLLRIFTIVTSTGKVDSLEVPYLASSLTDKELKRYAESMNFKVTKTRKSRV
jgi:hypothetical protein